MALLICGDSFASDWTVKYNDYKGWVNLLAEQYTVTNLAMAGSSIVRTLQQLESVNIHNYDAIIVFHTSPNRIYVKEHPVHKNDILHSNSDLIHTDIKHHATTRPELQCIVDYIEHYYDLDYAVFVYNLIEEKIDQMLSGYQGKIIHITNISREGLYKFNGKMISITNLFNKHPGLINHLSEHGNKLLFDRIQKLLK